MPLPLHPASQRSVLPAGQFSFTNVFKPSQLCSQLLQQIMQTVNRVWTRPHDKEQGACRVHWVVREIVRHFRKHWLIAISNAYPSGQNVRGTPCIFVHYYSTSMMFKLWLDISDMASSTVISLVSLLCQSCYYHNAICSSSGGARKA